MFRLLIKYIYKNLQEEWILHIVLYIQQILQVTYPYGGS